MATINTPLAYGINANYDFALKQMAIRRANLIGYWSLTDHSGTAAVARVGTNGVYTAAGLTLNQPSGMIDGHGGVRFNGSGANSGLCNIYSANLVATFNPLAGTIIAWVTVDSWTDAAARYIAYVSVDNNNRVYMGRDTTNGRLTWYYTAGGTAKSAVYVTASPATIFCIGMTWDKNAGANGELKAYYQGVQRDTTKTALGAWTGALASAACNLGGGYSNGFLWHGIGQEVALYNAALTPTEMAASFAP